MAHILRLQLSAALAPHAQITPVVSAHTSSCHWSGLNLYLGHALGLVTHVKEQWKQAMLHFLPHLSPVSPHRHLHHVSEEADGGLSQLAGRLVGRKTGELQQQLLPAHGEQGL